VVSRATDVRCPEVAATVRDLPGPREILSCTSLAGDCGVPGTTVRKNTLCPAVAVATAVNDVDVWLRTVSLSVLAALTGCSGVVPWATVGLVDVLFLV
jgi:hypothetical protein